MSKIKHNDPFSTIEKEIEESTDISDNIEASIKTRYEIIESLRSILEIASDCKNSRCVFCIFSKCTSSKHFKCSLKKQG